MKNRLNFKVPEMRKARIEIIPMIDTIFFLLVYFMFISLSMVQMKGMGVSLPKESDMVASKPPPRITVTVDPRGEYFVDKVPVFRATLVSRIQSHIDAQPTGVVVVDVDKHQPTQVLISIMDAVNEVTVPGSNASPPLAIGSPDPSAGSTSVD